MTTTNALKKILVVEDEQSLRKDIIEMLNYEGFEVIGAENGRVGIEQAREHLPDLIICDIMMPEVDGYAVLDELRKETRTAAIPFIFLTARTDKMDRRLGMEQGADDYLTKPFGTGELMARMRVAQRRQLTNADEPVFQIGALKMDISRRVVALNEKEIALTPTEYDLLKALITHAGKVITHRQLLKLVWGEGYDDMHILRVNISNLRRKIEPDAARPTYLVTEAGVGYRLRVDS